MKLPWECVIFTNTTLCIVISQILKISRVLEQTANEGNTLNRVRPARWMAPESLAKQICSKKSDMWMFGMLVYEIVARQEPFADKDPLDISTRIRDEGLTPTIPKECPVVLRDVMQMCWNKDPEQRPTMEVVFDLLERALTEAEAIGEKERETITQTANSLLKRSEIITFTELIVERKIGTGSYGKVCLGKWNAAPVALKFCRKKGNVEDFMREIRLMIELPPHPNVVHMFGVSLNGPQPIIVLEYCA
jgi:serine/threonine protein kinase